MIPMQSEQTDQICAALIKVHSSIGDVPKSGEGDKNTYATVEDIMGAINAPCEKYGVLVCPWPMWIDGQHVMILHLMHPESKQFMNGYWPLDADANKYITGSQGRGSAATYAKRYLITNMLRLKLSDETDDDGKSASRQPKKEQKKEQKSGADTSYIWTLLNKEPNKEQKNALLKDLCKQIGVPLLKDFNAAQVEEAIEMLENYFKE